MIEGIREKLKKVGSNDCVIVIKNGQIEQHETLDFGEVTVKFHDNKVKHVDVTQKIKY